MQGALFLACMNRSLTLEAPTPTNISTKSLPLIMKKGTSASPAMAFARRVFPVPGGPTSRTPLGILPPSRVNFSGLLRNSTISLTSSFASSTPATSSKVILFCPSPSILARFFPKLIAFEPPACTCLMKKTMSATSMKRGPQFMSIWVSELWFRREKLNSMPLSSSFAISISPAGPVVVNPRSVGSAFLSSPFIVFSPNSTFASLSLSRCSRNLL